MNKYQAYNTDWRRRKRAADPELAKSADMRAKRKSLYGLTEERHLRLLEEQDDGCAICGEVPRDGERPLSVDHNHKTGEIRGLLCDNCNHGLGKFKDDPARLREAADYLEGVGTHG